MAYVDSSGQTHVSLSEASSGHAAQTTASRDATGNVIGDSTGSRYVQEQEAQAQAKAAEQEKLKALYLSQSQQQQDAKLQKQITAVSKERPTTNPFESQTEPHNQGFISRTVNSFKQGYAAGSGGSYSLEGLKAPTHKAQDLKTYPIYEKANHLSEKYNSVQNSALSGLPSSHGKDLITGVSNVPEMAISTVGSIPLGVETIIKNPTSISDSVGLGLGAITGATVLKAKTHPLELVGEIGGSFMLAKAGGSLKGKLQPGLSKGLSKQGLNEFAKSEEGAFNLGGTKAGRKALEEWDKIDSTKNAKLESGPSYELIEDSTGNLILKEISTEKIKTSPTATKIPEPKLSKWEEGQKRGRDIINRGASLGGGDHVITGSGGMKTIMKTELKQANKSTEDIHTIDLTGMKTPEETAGARLNLFKAEQKRTESIDSLHTHLEQSTFVRNPIEITHFTPKIKSLKTPGLQRKMTQAQKNAYERKQRDSLNIDTSLGKVEELKIEQPFELQTSPATKEIVTQDVFSLPKIAQKEKVTQDVFSIPKMTQKEKVTQDVFSIPKMTQKESGVVIPPLSYHLPFAVQDFSIQVTQKQRNRDTILPVNPYITKNSQFPDPVPIPDINQFKDTKFPDPVPIPGINQFKDTKFPDPFPDENIIIPPPPNGIIIPPPPNGTIIPPPPNGTIIPPPPNGTIIPPPMGGFDFNFDVADGLTPKRRKTKNKTMKNKYGDPFDIKINFKL